MLRKFPHLAPLPYFTSNTLIIPLICKYVYGTFEASLGFFYLTVGLGELVCAYIGGIILYYVIRKTNLIKYIKFEKQ